MTQETSKIAYHEALATGLIGRKQEEVYRVLYNAGAPMTAGEVAEVLAMLSDKNSRAITPRFAELKRMNAIEEIGKRPCGISGKLCFQYKITGKLPTIPLKRRTKDEIISELQLEVQRLTALVEQHNLVA